MEIMSYARSNLISGQFKNFCSKVNTEQVILSSYRHQSNGQIASVNKFVKCTRKKCTVANNDTNLILLPIWPTLLWPGLPSLATLLFKRSIRDLIENLDKKLQLQ